MATTTNVQVQDLIQHISRTVSEHEIEKTKLTSEQVKKMYVEGDNISAVKLVMVAHDLEGEVF
jgi:hypothetical protein